MPKLNKKNPSIKPKKEKSSLLEFVERPLPTDEEVQEFEEIVEDELREDEIDESLNEIYQDDSGNMVDVSKFKIKKKRGFFYYFFSFVILISVLAAAGYGIYYFYYQNTGNSASIEFEIEGSEKVTAGEEFFYKINFRNPNNVNIKNIRIEVDFPDNFIMLDSFPEPSEKSNVWYFDSLVARASNSIKIKGKIIDKEDAQAITVADVTYVPENFSSEFKKEASFVTKVNSVGLDFDTSYSSNALVGEENEISVSFQPMENNFFDNFLIETEKLENIEFTINNNEEDDSKKSGEGDKLEIKKLENNIWQASGISPGENELIIKYKVKEKIADEQKIVLTFKQAVKKGEEDVDYVFYEKEINLEVMKSDLNLNLEINDKKTDSGVNFGEKLNYKITYVNKGDQTMKDLVVMAVLDSEFLDWTTLKDENEGEEKGNTLFWSKEQIPELAEIEPEGEGEIIFSIEVLPFREADLGKKFEITSYTQFTIGEAEEVKENNDNRSNTIINKINSDLSLVEEIRYFNEDNIPVGSGPLPPKVDEITTFKVYWTVTNNVHELNDAKVEVELPDYVSWSDKERTSVGSVYYEANGNKIVWQIGRLPVSVYRADAEFSINLAPTKDDRNKILVLTPGSVITAIDTETDEIITEKTSAKTTKLEDDEIAQMNNEGRIE